jgi:hypothetical protein
MHRYVGTPVCQYVARANGAVLAGYRCLVSTPVCRYVSTPSEAGQCWLSIDTSVRHSAGMSPSEAGQCWLQHRCRYASMPVRQHSGEVGQCWLDIDTPVCQYANGMSAPKRGRQANELRRTMPSSAPERGRVVLAEHRYVGTPVRRAVSTRTAGCNAAEYQYVVQSVRQRLIRTWQAS